MPDWAWITMKVWLVTMAVCGLMAWFFWLSKTRHK